MEKVKEAVDKLTFEISKGVFGGNIFGYRVPAHLITHTVMIATAVMVVAIGCQVALTRPKNALESNKEDANYDDTDVDSVPLPMTEMSESGSVMVIPVTVTITLVTLHQLIKRGYIDDITTWMLRLFKLFQFRACCAVFTHGLKYINRKCPVKFVERYRFTLSKDNEIHPPGTSNLRIYPQVIVPESVYEALEENAKTAVAPADQKLNAYFSDAEVVGLIAASAFIWFYHRVDGNSNWILSGFLSNAIVIHSSQAIQLTRFKFGFMLLAGLFLYDVYFVFFSTAMMDVATSIKIPMTVSVPMLQDLDVAELHLKERLPVSLIGLGDLTVPQMFISICLRFDAYMFHRRNPYTPYHVANRFPMPYFITGLVAYALSLILTVTVMTITKHGQPALFYISPILSMSVIVVGYFRGELEEIWDFDSGYAQPNEAQSKKFEDYLNLFSGELEDEGEQDPDYVDTEVDEWDSDGYDFNDEAEAEEQ